MERALLENWRMCFLSQCSTGRVRDLQGLPQQQLLEQQQELARVPSSSPSTLLCRSAGGTYPLLKRKDIVLWIREHWFL